jgi:hypothetical protein
MGWILISEDLESHSSMNRGGCKILLSATSFYILIIFADSDSGG